MSATDLACVFDSLFGTGSVLAAILDSDRHIYPVGSACVPLSSREAFDRAIAAHYIQVRSARFEKTVPLFITASLIIFYF